MTLFVSEFSSKASKQISKLDEVTKFRVRSKIERLENAPFPTDSKRLGGYNDEKVFRVRVGDLRILYLVRYNPNKVIIINVDKRSKVYER